MKEKVRKAGGGLSPRVLRPKLVHVVLLLAVAGLTVSMISARVIREQWYRTEEQLRSTSEDRTEALACLERVFSAMMRQRARDDYPVSPETLEVLANLTASYHKFISRNANVPSLRMDRARAYRLLGQVYSLHNEVNSAEAAYREARKILLELINEVPRPDYRYLLAENDLQLSHLLAELDHTQDAERLSLEAMREFEWLAEEFPTAPQYVSELGIAYNNLGLLSLRLGRDQDATRYLRQNVSLMARLVNTFPDDPTYVERLIDSQQVLVGLLWSMGQLEDAREVSVEGLSTIRQYKESLRGTLELEVALNMALENRSGVERAMALQQDGTQRGDIQTEASPSVRPLFSKWDWRSLYPHDGKGIQPDILVEGVLPAEFEKHDALLLGFTWSLGEAWEEVCLKIIAASWQRVQVIVLVPDALAQEAVIDKLRQMEVPVERLRFWQVPTDTVWVRDYGPPVVRTSQDSYKWVDIRNGGIGRARDGCVPTVLGRLMRLTSVRASMALDGGNLLTNGQGLCITTTQLLEMNQDLGYDESHVANTIKRVFGATQIVYLDRLDGEKTGHVDIFAAFTAADTVVVGDYSGVDPVNAAILDRNAARLSKVVTASGPLRVERLPMPPRGRDHFGGTYTNVVFANGVLLVPTYPDAPRDTEEQVLATYRRLLPAWDVIGIDSGALISFGGALRCAVLPLHRIRPVNGVAKIEVGVE
jgi:agmatine/peptidylarginine deiminase/tetratricopeptide (TPR) repeat protein